MISTTLLTFCKTSTTGDSYLDWPKFPPPVVAGQTIVTFDETSDTVSMPLWYWKDITKYAMDMETTITLLVDIYDIHLEWTKFPNPKQDNRTLVRYDAQTDSVIMSLTFWKNIVKYVMDAERNIDVANILIREKLKE